VLRLVDEALKKDALCSELYEKIITLATVIQQNLQEILLKQQEFLSLIYKFFID